MKPILNFRKNIKRTEKPQRTDYSKYRYTKPELILYASVGAGIGVIICWLCYNSIYAAPVSVITCIVYLKKKKKELIKKRKNTLLYHFNDFLNALNISLGAGYSLENGIKSSLEDMKQLHGEKDVIVNELKIMASGLKIKKPIEELFRDLGERSDEDDIRLFSEMITTARKHGGGLVKVLSDTRKIINEKIETKHETEKILGSKIYEQKIMSIMPAAVIIYLRLTFDGFIEQLYGNIAGVIIMSGCLLVYMGAYYLGKKIVNIEI
jgi:tight adherence protein B